MGGSIFEKRTLFFQKIYIFVCQVANLLWCYGMAMESKLWHNVINNRLLHHGAEMFQHNYLFIKMLGLPYTIFLLNPTLNTSPESHLQKVLSCRLSCHTWGLKAWDHVWSGKSQLPYFQRLRLLKLPSSDYGLRTWDPMWIGPFNKPNHSTVNNIKVTTTTQAPSHRVQTVSWKSHAQQVFSFFPGVLLFWSFSSP